MTDLAALVTLHRQLLARELRHLKMTTEAAPSEVNLDGPRAKPKTQSGASGGWTGMPFTGTFARYLDGQYVETMPYAAALTHLRRQCRSHLGHTQREEWRGALCHRLVMWVIYWGYRPEVAAQICGIDMPHAEQLLTSSLRTITQHLEARAAPPSEKAEPEEYSPTRLSRAICEAVNREVRDFEVEQRIWEAMRHRDPTLRSWEDEWAARQAKILEHRATCERCRLEEAA